MRMAYHNRHSRSLLRFCTCHRRCAPWPEGFEGGGIRPIVGDGQLSVAATVCDVEVVAKLASWGEGCGDCSGTDSPRGGATNRGTNSNFWFVPHHVGITHNPRDTRVSSVTLQEILSTLGAGMVYSKAS